MIKSTHKLFADDTSLYASVNHETKHDTQGMIENDHGQHNGLLNSTHQNLNPYISHVSLLIYFQTSHLNK